MSAMTPSRIDPVVFAMLFQQWVDRIPDDGRFPRPDIARITQEAAESVAAGIGYIEVLGDAEDPKGLLWGVMVRSGIFHEPWAVERLFYVSPKHKMCARGMAQRFEDWAVLNGAKRSAMSRHFFRPKEEDPCGFYKSIGYEETETIYTKEL